MFVHRLRITVRIRVSIYMQTISTTATPPEEEEKKDTTSVVPHTRTHTA